MASAKYEVICCDNSKYEYLYDDKRPRHERKIHVTRIGRDGYIKASGCYEIDAHNERVYSISDFRELMEEFDYKKVY